MPHYAMNWYKEVSDFQQSAQKVTNNKSSLDVAITTWNLYVIKEVPFIRQILLKYNTTLLHL